MQIWALQSEQAKTNKIKVDSDEDEDIMNTFLSPSPREKKLSRSPDSRLELSSFFDNSDIMMSQYDDLHPRKADSKALVRFKRSMLETIIKPKTWRNHRDKI